MSDEDSRIIIILLPPDSIRIQFVLYIITWAALDGVGSGGGWRPKNGLQKKPPLKGDERILERFGTSLERIVQFDKIYIVCNRVIRVYIANKFDSRRSSGITMGGVGGEFNFKNNNNIFIFILFM